MLAEAGARVTGYALPPQTTPNHFDLLAPASRARSVLEVATAGIARIGASLPKMDAEGNHPHEARLLQLNCDKANREQQWFPRWDASPSLEQTVDWYAAVAKGDVAESVTRVQVRGYFAPVART